MPYPANALLSEKIITNTFKPLLKDDEKMPAELAPKLLHRFWSKEGYELQPGASEALQYLHEPSESPSKKFDQIVVGVITNSDPRVPDVLSSLGLNISPLRYGTLAPERGEEGEADENSEQCGSKRGPDAMSTPEDRGDAKKTRVDSNTLQKYDVDFSVMSYDVGHEKPNVKIFRAAETMLDAALTAQGDTFTSRDSKAWEKIYVGDEYDKDIVGAQNAKWKAVLISEEPVDDDETGVKWLEDEPGGDLMPLFRTRYDAVAFGSLHRIADWLHL